MFAEPAFHYDDVEMTAERLHFRALLIALLLLPLLLAAAPEPGLLPQDLTVRAWNEQHGLPDDSVAAVIQTRDGYLWAGTARGLARFDGVRFVNTTSGFAKSNAPVSVTALCEDSAGRLWIGTQADGLLVSVNRSVSRFEPSGFHEQTITSIACDDIGHIWLGTPTGLIRIQEQNQNTGNGGAAETGSGNDRFEIRKFTSQDGLPHEFVSSVNVARSGIVWITTRGGMCQFRDGALHPFPFQIDGPGRNPESLGVYEDRQGNLWAFGDTYLVNLAEGKHLNHFGTSDGTASMRIWSLCEGRNGELWIGTSGKGLYCFAKGKFTALSLRHGGLTSDVRALCEDREGNLWLGTHGDGLIRIQPRNVRILDTAVGLPNLPAVCLAFERSDQAWIGFLNGGLLRGAGERFEAVTAPHAAAFQNLVSSVCVSGGNVWIATPGSGLYCFAKDSLVHFTTANGLADNRVFSLAADNNGVVWAGSGSGVLHRIENGIFKRFGPADGLPSQPLRAILPVRDGALWLGFADGTLVRGENNRFRTVVDPTAVDGKTITALHEDEARRLWFATAGGRLGCVAGGRLVSWDWNPLSRDVVITGILSGEDGSLCLATGRSIYRIIGKNVATMLSTHVFSDPQLILSLELASANNLPFGWPRALKSPDERLWFAMDNCVVMLDLRNPFGEQRSPPVLIEDIALTRSSGQEHPIQLDPQRNSAGTRPQIQLPADLQSLEIHFTALNFSAPEKTRFRHRLDGFDPDWVVDGEGVRSVHYGRLAYGNYTFRVQAGSSEGVWHPDEASFGFAIPTPLWRRNWAIAAYVFVAVVVVAGTARLFSNRRLRRRLAALAAQQAMERERMRIAQDMHDEIGSKLTKISFMSERAKRELQTQDSVAQKLDAIAGTSRDLLQSLDEIVWAVNPHNDSLERLAAYLGQYATEYLQNTAVECELHIPRDLPHRVISAEARHNLFLAFEESLNNALKHGRPGRVHVRMHASDSQFEISVEDNGSGFTSANQTASSRNGLRNMQQRLSEIGGRCEVNSQPGKGTSVRFSIPLGPAIQNEVK